MRRHTWSPKDPTVADTAVQFALRRAVDETRARSVYVSERGCKRVFWVRVAGGDIPAGSRVYATAHPGGLVVYFDESGAETRREEVGRWG